jgi:DNA (cytosine-5)-methyltransferase 1
LSELSHSYQVQATLLQSGHYGAPQGRIRFFLFAALIGYPLPSIPQPTHDFPHPDNLVINFPNGQTIQTVLTMRGTAPRPFVNIDDAIGDLPRFDWYVTSSSSS